MTLEQDIINSIKSVIGDHDVPVPLHEPLFSGNEKSYVGDCVDSGWVSSVGEYLTRFENNLAEFCGTNYAVGVVNGTSALHIALKLSGVRAGDEVLVPALTFVASANAISYCAASPNFIDSENERLGLDPQKLRLYLKNNTKSSQDGLINKQTGARIAALMPVHIFGHPVDIQALEDIAGEYELPLIYDAAEALGSKYQGQSVFSNKLSATSFNGNKIMTTGGGGAILSDDEELANHVKHLVNVAKQAHPWEFYHDELGYNYRMPALNAALGCAQLEQLPKFLDHKRVLAKRYLDVMDGHNDFKILKEPEDSKSNYWLNALILDDLSVRDEILQNLHDHKLFCRPIWQLMTDLPMYKNAPRDNLDCAVNIQKRVINLPSSVHLSSSYNAIKDDAA